MSNVCTECGGSCDQAFAKCYSCRIREWKESKGLTDSQRAIRAECRRVEGILLDKNRAYGDSALNPVRVFSKSDTVEQLRVRLDDKLSRLARGQAAGEDVTLDLIGYLILLRVAEKREERIKDEG